MLNHVIIMGRMTKEPELRTTNSGKPVASFSVAVERDMEKDGKREADFLDCVAWGKTGEFVSRYFPKGKMICVEGRVQNRDWTDKQGNKRRSTEVLVSGVHFCGDSNKGTQAVQQPQGYAPQFTPPPAIQSYGSYSGVPATPTQADFCLLEGEDADLPF